MRHRSAISHTMETLIGGLIVAYITDIFQLYVSPLELLQLLKELVSSAFAQEVSQDVVTLDFTVAGGFLLASVIVAYCWGYVFHAVFLE